ncbi:MAG: TonB-dependent receptor [Flavobacteriaceae bacterium]|nr:TonB-dependent receptor [Flavobacteriaceae bacterium]
MNKSVALFISIFCTLSVQAQTTIKGKITNTKGEAIPYATVIIRNTTTGISADEHGIYNLKINNQGNIVLKVSSAGYMAATKQLLVNKSTIHQDFSLKEFSEVLNEVTITGTKTNKRSTKNPVIVNVINSVTLANVQACNLSEGLKFQTGLRVETDCQTCNYTQLRMNGLSGGYSQILINGRPIFSPLTGLYGLEQIPTNMIDRIEVVRGGGSALYGSSAIGGTVNVITKIPKRNDYSFGYTYQNIDGVSDQIISGNATVVNEDRNAGISFFVNNRNRNLYDANNDTFSELPQLKNNAFGTNLFFLPTDDQKIEINFSKLNEYRYGGEITNEAAHLALQSEERTHDVYAGNIDYQINFNKGKSSLITYFASQYTGRKHYTGIYPDTPAEIQQHLENPPYGNSKTTTLQAGLQFNYKAASFFKGNNVFTIGAEFVQDAVFDEIKAYNYNVDQLTKNLGIFLQSDWEISSKVSVLTGLRIDKHNFVSKAIVSPRISFLYNFIENTQFRATWGTGFRAPQAFDTDLHIAFAGGGISRVSLANNLQQERSNSYTFSINYDKPTEHYIYGFTLESFYTHLEDAFYLHPLGTDTHGELFEKRNGDGATVRGLTIEGRLNYDQRFQIETGFTFQSSLFDRPIKNSDVLPAKRRFLRTPNNYGYATLNYTPNTTFNTSLNIVYTGTMELLHLASTGNLTTDAYVTSPSFTEIGLKAAYKFKLTTIKTTVELFSGIKNLTNAYQHDFDKGKERDSNYIYGPATPRTYFIGLKFSPNL